MKVEFKIGFEGELFVKVREFALKEGIDEKQAVAWLVQGGLKFYNGVPGQVRLERAKEEEREKK